jgi:hypothetical protein
MQTPTQAGHHSAVIPAILKARGHPEKAVVVTLPEMGSSSICVRLKLSARTAAFMANEKQSTMGAWLWHAGPGRRTSWRKMADYGHW